MTVSVNRQECIGCAKCVKECFPRDIVMVEGKASIKNKTCIKCGHCIAVCPVNCITMDDYDMTEVKEYNEKEFKINSDNLLNAIKFRRTIRQFEDREVEEEKLLKVIEAGRFTQTGANLQNVEYIVVREKIKDLREKTYEAIKGLAENILDNSEKYEAAYKRYAKMWLQMYEGFEKYGAKGDTLFFDASSLIVVKSDSLINGSLAGSNMALMTEALGLGCTFSGFFKVACDYSEELREFIGLEKGQEVVVCMIMGYPAVEYQRTVPRKKAEITFM